MKISRKPYHAFFILMSAVCAAGCQSRIGTGDGPTFSEGHTYLLTASSMARYRYSYVDSYKTPKEFLIVLTKSGDCIFRKKYEVGGWDVSWQTEWTSPTDVVVNVFDFGEGVDHRNSERRPLHQRAIEEISLHIDPNAGNVVEHTSAT
jgi:hypothetical protein